MPLPILLPGIAELRGWRLSFPLSLEHHLNIYVPTTHLNQSHLAMYIYGANACLTTSPFRTLVLVQTAS